MYLGSKRQDGLDDFGEAFPSFLACNIGGEVLHVVGEVENVLHACCMREILEHWFVIERIAAEDESIPVVIEV